MRSSNATSTVRGEGDYASDRKCNEQAQPFAQSGKVGQAAQDASPRNARERADISMAETEGRAHAEAKIRSGHGNDGARGRHKPDKRAPGRHPQGRKPAPEKFPGR